MRILHMALSNFYIEGYNYQENILPRIHAQKGHQVLMIASCVSFGKDGKACLVQPCKYHSQDGFDVIRLPYRKPFSRTVLRRVRTYPGVYKLVEAFHPDIIYFHGCSGWEIRTVARYKKAYPQVKLFADSHADLNNSAQKGLSRYIQHQLYYRSVLRTALPQIEKILCPSLECMDFCKELYHVPEEMLEFYPLGGTIVPPAQREEVRKRIREKEGIGEECIVFTHSGKIDVKKRTAELIHAFEAVPQQNFRLLIIGVLMDDVKEELTRLMEKDNRILYLGWEKSEELIQYLCASDVYVQPGGQSATMQNAMCSGCAVMLYPHKSHQPYVSGNGYFIRNEEEITACLENIAEHPELLPALKRRSFEIAQNILDYEKLADRIFQ